VRDERFLRRVRRPEKFISTLFVMFANSFIASFFDTMGRSRLRDPTPRVSPRFCVGATLFLGGALLFGIGST